MILNKSTFNVIELTFAPSFNCVNQICAVGDDEVIKTKFVTSRYAAMTYGAFKCKMNELLAFYGSDSLREESNETKSELNFTIIGDELFGNKGKTLI